MPAVQHGPEIVACDITAPPPKGGRCQGINSVMIIPVRCVTCGKVVGDKWRWFESKLKDEAPEEATATEQSSRRARLLDELGLKRMCCRRHLLTTVDVMDKI